MIGIERFNAECRESVFTFLEEWDRLTERIGFWLDLEHAYRTLDETYIESVWWALRRSTRGACCTRATRWCPTARAARRRSPRTRSRSATATSSTRASSSSCPCAAARSGCSCGRPRRGRCPGNVAVAVSPTATYATGARRRRDLRARRGSRRAGARRGASRCSSASRARSWWSATAPTRDRSSRPSDRERGAAADHRRRVRDDRGRHRHRAPRARLRRGRLPRGGGRAERAVRPDAGRRRSTTRSSPTAPTTARVRSRDGDSFEGRFVKDPALTEELIDDLARAACCCGCRTTSTPTRTAGAAARRCSTTPNRPGTSPPRACATSCWRPTRQSTGTRRTSSTGASATG